MRTARRRTRTRGPGGCAALAPAQRRAPNPAALQSQVQARLRILRLSSARVLLLRQAARPGAGPVAPPVHLRPPVRQEARAGRPRLHAHVSATLPSRAVPPLSRGRHRHLPLRQVNAAASVRPRASSSTAAPTHPRRPRRSCTQRSFACGSPCGRTLACGVHACAELCHSGECPPCGRTSSQACLCGKSTQERRCDEPEWQCTAVCGKPLACGRHTCAQVCHGGECPPCPTSGPRRCHCGAVLLADAACDDPGQSCGRVCGKVLLPARGAHPTRVPVDAQHAQALDCYGGHTCSLVCHDGDCPPCLRSVDAQCMCGAATKKAACVEARGFRCDRKCRRVRPRASHPGPRVRRSPVGCPHRRAAAGGTRVASAAARPTRARRAPTLAGACWRAVDTAAPRAATAARVPHAPARTSACAHAAPRGSDCRVHRSPARPKPLVVAAPDTAARLGPHLPSPPPWACPFTASCGAGGRLHADTSFGMRTRATRARARPVRRRAGR